MRPFVGIGLIMLGSVIGLTPNTPGDFVVGVLMTTAGLVIAAVPTGARR